jgi:hypothetical protein
MFTGEPVYWKNHRRKIMIAGKITVDRRATSKSENQDMDATVSSIWKLAGNGGLPKRS